MRFPIFRLVFAVISLIIFYSFAPAQGQWSPPGCISETPVDYSSRIIAQGDTLHVVFVSYHPGVGTGNGYLRSTDAGWTWSPQGELADTADTNPNEYPNVMAFGGDLIAVWRTYFPQSFRRRNIAYSVSHDNGATWSPHARLSSFSGDDEEGPWLFF